MALESQSGEGVGKESMVDDSVEVCVLGVDGETKCTVSAKSDWKIAQVKREISSVVDRPVAELKLVFGERVLFNDVLLSAVWGRSSRVTVTLMRISREAATTDGAATGIQSGWRARRARQEAAARLKSRQAEAEATDSGAHA
mmetsp:Transcript_80620/g.250193  ORF Transcript_80620/g.250193 Transcript_80620/m.250193 type:complete len:142 (-) Transcript_80620:117-542(-)